MGTRTGGQVFVDRLIHHQVNDLFLIPGVQLDWAVEALREKAQAINLYIPRHEQTTTYMADGYYRVSGKPGVAMVVPGPGVLNAGAGLATAYASNSRVLFLTAQIRSNAVGKGYGLLHEIPDQSGMIRGLSKAHYLARSGNEIVPVVDAAFDSLLSGRSRPVGVEIPHDFFETQIPEGRATVEAQHDFLPELDQSKLDQIAKLLDKARFPVLFVGGGALMGDASTAVLALAEKLSLPVVMSDNGRGVVDDRHPLAMSTLAGRAVFEKADVVLVVGSRFMDNSLTPTPSWPQSGIQFLYINIDANDLASPRVPTVALQADAKQALEALADRVHPRTVLSATQAQAVKSWAAEQVKGIMPQSAYIDAIRTALPEDGIFVNELTQVGYLSRVAFPVYAPRTYISPGYQGTLGYGFPTALGAAVAAQGRRVVSVTGDGGFGWNMQELATAARYQLPVTLIVFNDGHYGNVRAIQKRVFGHEVAVQLTNPDFQQLAKAFNVAATQVSNPAALGAAMKEAGTHPGPCLIEVNVGEMPSPWPLIRLQPMAGIDIKNKTTNPLNEE